MEGGRESVSYSHGLVLWRARLLKLLMFLDSIIQHCHYFLLCRYFYSHSPQVFVCPFKLSLLCIVLSAQVVKLSLHVMKPFQPAALVYCHPNTCYTYIRGYKSITCNSHNPSKYIIRCPPSHLHACMHTCTHTHTNMHTQTHHPNKLVFPNHSF